MKRWLSPLLSVLFLFGALSPAWGNGAPPPPRPAPLPEAKTVEVKVVIDERVTAPRFIIPKSMMAEKKSASLETTTIVAGLALTLAFVSGGVWLVRRGKARAVAAVILTLSALTFGTTTLLADIAKPPPPPAPVPVTLPADIMFTGKVEIEFVEKGDEVKVLVKKAWVTEKKKVEPKTEPKTEPKPNEKSGND
jgi:hypothetical protein